MIKAQVLISVMRTETGSKFDYFIGHEHSNHSLYFKSHYRTGNGPCLITISNKTL